MSEDIIETLANSLEFHADDWANVPGKYNCMLALQHLPTSTVLVFNDTHGRSTLCTICASSKAKFLCDMEEANKLWAARTRAQDSARTRENVAAKAALTEIWKGKE